MLRSLAIKLVTWKFARLRLGVQRNDDLEDIGMPMFKSSITIPSYAQAEIIRPLVQSAFPSVKKQDCQDVVIRQRPGGLIRRFGAFVRECWRRMRVMEAASERLESSDGALSRERSEERLRDEQAWSENARCAKNRIV